MDDKIQANLKPETVQRVASIANKPVTRGIDKMINQCLDELEKRKRNCAEESSAATEAAAVTEVESESKDE